MGRIYLVNSIEQRRKNFSALLIGGGFGKKINGNQEVSWTFDELKVMENKLTEEFNKNLVDDWEQKL